MFEILWLRLLLPIGLRILLLLWLNEELQSIIFRDLSLLLCPLSFDLVLFEDVLWPVIIKTLFNLSLNVGLEYKFGLSLGPLSSLHVPLIQLFNPQVAVCPHS